MICVSLSFIDENVIEKLIGQGYLVELRLDLVENKSDFDKVIEKYKAFVVTYRGDGNLSVRLEFLEKAINSGVDYVDVDVDDVELQDRVREKVIGGVTGLILSYHNFEATPERDELIEIYEGCTRNGADIVKIVTMINEPGDNARILSLYEVSKGNLIAFGMGDKGKITRMVAPLLGAPFVYASYSDEKKTANGQLDYISLKEVVSTIKKYL